ncbi:hypothetical protein HC251_25265 (plasmid) [Iamia sp. SCSIO 61187]|uniref:DUF6112 family protein n=1 Tax=Iamia sp. SCSIO 61187 TaxID=2722752 RepID=UPI001C634D36|nr:DUF6112 family protein [Iamia sp. SCSIO 61187]QYG95861.1 hypothetical protein HC251_25265 [Iamia sp. SCSIO 61187]
MTWLTTRLVLVLAEVNVNPDADALPETSRAVDIVNGVAFWSLLACAIALVAGGAAWAIGGMGSNMQATSGGKRAVLLSLVGAAVIGSASTLINWAAG